MKLFAKLSVLLVAVLFVALPRASSASDCAQLADKAFESVQASHDEAQQAVTDFIWEDVSATTGAPDLLAEAEKIRNDELGKANERYDKAFDEYIKCMEKAGGHSFTCDAAINKELQILEKATDKIIEKSLESMPDGLQNAHRRAKEASKLTHGVTTKLLNNATDLASAAGPCMAQGKSISSQPKGPVDLTDTPTKPTNSSKPGPPKVAKSGMSAGVKIATGVLAAGAGVAAGVYIPRLINNATTPGGAACPSAADIERDTGGSLAAAGPDTVCSQYSPFCSNVSLRVCIKNWCSNDCSYYYQRANGQISQCAMGGCASGQIMSGFQDCALNAAQRVANWCR